MDASKFADVNFVIPLFYLGVAVVCLLIFIPLLIHGMLRRRKFSTLVDGYQTYALRSSIRIELIVSALVAILTIMFLAMGATGYFESRNNLEANIQLKYNPTQLELGPWNGSWATADLTLSDGTVFDDVEVMLQDSGEPFIEKVWYHERDKRNE